MRQLRRRRGVTWGSRTRSPSPSWRATAIFSVFEASRTDPSASDEQDAAVDIMSGESCRRTGDRAAGGRMRGSELGRYGELGRSRRCGDVESDLEKGWPEMGMRGRRRLAAAAVVRGEWIQSERGRR
jgi:hypothetical protein